MDVFASGAWRTVTRAEAQISGGWRTITRGEAYINGAWRTILSFTRPLSLAVTPEVTGFRFSAKPTGGNVTTDPATATPSGGVAPYRYSWSITTGTATIASPSNASTAFTAFLPANSSRIASALVICTDANGSQASGTCQISFDNESSA